MNHGIDSLVQARQRLPLSALMTQLGWGDSAKTSARCPFHEDLTDSFSVFRSKDGTERWNCLAGCGQGDAIDFLAKARGLAPVEACREFIRMAGVQPGPPPVRGQAQPVKLESRTRPVVHEDAEGEGSSVAPFPMDALPPVMALMCAAIARCERVPDVLPVVCALGVASAAIGAGLEVESGPNRVTRGNLFLLASADSGSGKTQTMNLVAMPLTYRHWPWDYAV